MCTDKIKIAKTKPKANEINILYQSAVFIERLWINSGTNSITAKKVMITPPLALTNGMIQPTLLKKRFK
ncbi:hypothetical protein MG1601_79 [Mycoplasmoides gallisepticum]